MEDQDWEVLPIYWVSVSLNPYRIGTDRRWAKSIELVNDFFKTKDFDLLFYACLELRYSMENFLRLYISLIDESLINKLDNIYSSKDLANLINNLDHEFENKIDFLNIFLSKKYNDRINKINLRESVRLYGRIGSYLHAKFNAVNTVKNIEWWHEMLKNIHECQEYIRINARFMGTIKLDDQGLEIYKKWKQGKATQKEIDDWFSDMEITKNI